MKQKIKTLTGQIIDNLSQNSTAASIEQTNKDFKNALLIVSISINIFIFTAWLTLHVASVYGTQLASTLLAL